MADKKISQLTEKDRLVENDVITILDSAASYANKKAKVSSLWQEFIYDTSSTSATIDIPDSGAFYLFSKKLTSLTINYEVSESGVVNETQINFRTDSTFTFSAQDLSGLWLGVDAPSFEPNTGYVIAIKGAAAVCAKVGA